MNRLVILISTLNFFVGFITILPSFGQKSKILTPNLTVLAERASTGSQPAVSLLPEGDKPGIRLAARPGGGIAYLSNLQFTNGTIEFDVRGKDLMQKSFVGIAFHGTNDSTYDAIYFRPFNFRSSDPVRQSHSVQYISAPIYHWERLRHEFPEKYESKVKSAPDPNEWFHVKVEVANPTISVYVNNASEPSLVVDQLGNQSGQKLGFWVGNNSSGDFANLKIISR